MQTYTQLNYIGNNKKVKLAIAEANKILSNPDFYKQIEAVNKFDFTDYNGKQIADEIHSLNKAIIVKNYWVPFSKTKAKTLSEISINTATLNRPVSSIVNTLIHETVHAVDWLTNNDWDYTHDGQKADGQENTAPWVIGDIAESMAN